MKGTTFALSLIIATGAVLIGSSVSCNNNESIVNKKNSNKK